MYGLPQAGILVKKLLKERLLQNDYFEVPHTPGLFRYKTRPIWFTLVVDDFGIGVAPPISRVVGLGFAVLPRTSFPGARVERGGR